MSKSLVRILSILGLTLVAGTVCLPAHGQDIRDSRYRDVSLANVSRSPQDFDQVLVRVQGVAQIQFEGDVLWVSTDARSAGRLDEAIWIDVGWPVSDLKAMSGTEVIVEARFDAHSHGHMGCCRGTLTDIRAMWRPGHESGAFVPNYETRVDALEQLRFKTGWIPLGTRARNGSGIQTWNGWIQNWFEFAAQPGGRVPQRIPRSGDRIRLTERLRIHIGDYAINGERNRLQSPQANRRSLSQGDETRLWLAPEAVVQVADVDVAWAGRLAEVWARVVPLTEK